MPDEFEKKTERLDVRLSHQKKQAFSDACETQGDTPSGAVRRFINSYIRRAGRDDMKAALRSGSVLKKFKLAGALAVCLVAGIIVIKFGNGAKTKMQAEQLFARYDFDNSGVLGLMEVSANDHHLHRVLNIDGKPGISRDEFITHGTMVWSFVVPEDRQIVENSRTKKRHRRRIVMRTQFDDLSEGALIPTGNPDKPYLTVEEFKALDKPIWEVRKNLKLDPQFTPEINKRIREFEEKNPRLNPHNFVMFDLRNPEAVRVDILEHKNRSRFSKSMTYSRSVEWVKDSDVPHYVMGQGSEDWEAMMAEKTPGY